MLEAETSSDALLAVMDGERVASVVDAVTASLEASEAKETEALDRILDAWEAADSTAEESVAVAETLDTDESREDARLEMTLLASLVEEAATSELVWVIPRSESTGERSPGRRSVALAEAEGAVVTVAEVESSVRSPTGRRAASVEDEAIELTESEFAKNVALGLLVFAAAWVKAELETLPVACASADEALVVAEESPPKNEDRPTRIPASVEVDCAVLVVEVLSLVEVTEGRTMTPGRPPVEATSVLAAVADAVGEGSEVMAVTPSLWTMELETEAEPVG